jgi:hypothetical protein
VGERELVLALERLGTDVGLVVAGIADSVTEPARDVRLRAVDVRAEFGRLRGQLIAHCT